MSNTRKQMIRNALLALVMGLFSTSLWASGTAELLEQADTAWAAGDLETAETNFKEAVANADNGEADLRLGGFYISQNRLADAINAFQSSLTKGLPSPKLESRAFLGMGIAYLHFEKTSLARAAFDEAANIDPSRADEIKLLLEEMDKKEKKGASAH